MKWELNIKKVDVKLPERKVVVEDEAKPIKRGHEKKKKIREREHWLESIVGMYVCTLKLKKGFSPETKW